MLGNRTHWTYVQDADGDSWQQTLKQENNTHELIRWSDSNL